MERDVEMGMVEVDTSLKDAAVTHRLPTWGRVLLRSSLPTRGGILGTFSLPTRGKV